jgi:uncharacterized protein (DUF1778 family)
MRARALITSEAKKERLEARVTPEQKKRIERAAIIKGTSISDFVVQSAADAAAETIRNHDVLVLNERAREVFVQALINPPAPGKRLAAAAKRYRQRMKL